MGKAAHTPQVPEVFSLGFRYTSCPVPKDEDADSPLCHHPISAMSQHALEASVEDHLEFAHGAIIDNVPKPPQ